MKFSHSPRIFTANASIFLDALRIIASLVVFWGHAYAQWHPNLNIDRDFLIDWGHFAVIVFFVLSGFVIAHTTAGINKGGINYAQARATRLYSVVFPALVITAVLEIVIKLLDPVMAGHYYRGASVIRYILSAFFLNEAWFFSASPPINGPLWSLSYEFWYYVIFGIFIYKPPKLKGWLLLLAGCLIIGPKVLLMMPVWLLGNFFYRVRMNISNTGLATTVVCALLIFAVYLMAILPPYPMHLGKAPLFFAGQFVTDFVVGIFVGLALAAIPLGEAVPNNNVKKNLAKRLRQLADLTFPLYVLHEPLLIFVRTLCKTVPYNLTQMYITMGIVFLICVMIGSLMEKSRPYWRQLFNGLINRRNFVLKRILK